MKLSVVIPALNEECAIGDVLEGIPIARLKRIGYEVEVIVVDNGSIDDTVRIAQIHGATVVVQPIRGYGNAYKAGFAYCTGDVVATGDADLTYPFSDLPKILRRMQRRDLEFVNTDRLSSLQSGVMTRSHVFGNWLLSVTTKVLFRWPYKDSQSGMWVFRRYVWDALDVRSPGMPFSQELKIEAFVRGFRCDEVPIEYRARAGKEKLNTVSDGLGNVAQLVRKRISLGIVPGRSGAVFGRAAVGYQTGADRHARVLLGDGDAGSVWDERWYDCESEADGAVPGLGAHVPLPALASVDSEAMRSRERRRMVVWRARPASSPTLTAARGPGQSQRDRFTEFSDENGALSAN